MRDEFVAIAAHELKIPLTALTAATQLALRQLRGASVPDVGQLRTRLTTIEQQARRFGALVERLLHVTALDTAPPTLRRRPTDLVRLVRRTLERAQPRIDRDRVVSRATRRVIVEIAVRDHGRGISPDKRAHLFERYYRPHPEDYASGLGLGLWISREIVRHHGGDVRAEFPPDGGSRFVVVLPARAGSDASAPRSGT